MLDTMVEVTPAAEEAATATTITGAGPGGVATAAPAARASVPGRWGATTSPPRATRSEHQNIQERANNLHSRFYTVQQVDILYLVFHL